jgi:hypothetical protein
MASANPNWKTNLGISLGVVSQNVLGYSRIRHDEERLEEGGKVQNISRNMVQKGFSEVGS